VAHLLLLGLVVVGHRISSPIGGGSKN
jgi:hypothetical protein